MKWTKNFHKQKNYKTSEFQDTHTIVYFSIILGQIACGFALGISGSALEQASNVMPISEFWMGLIGAGSLIGLMGSFFMGWLSDRIGRRNLLRINMYVMALLSLGHLFVDDLFGVFLLRLGIGLMLAIDYTVGNTWLIEWMPEKSGAQIQSRLLLFWMIGFILAYMTGLGAIAIPEITWQITFAAPCILGLLAAFFRSIARIPASPVWLIGQGEHALAQEEIESRLGKSWRIPLSSLKDTASNNKVVLANLFSGSYWRRTLTGAVFYACQAFSFFGISIFLPILLKKLQMTDVVMSGLLYNGAMLLGVVWGILAFSRIGRRTFLLSTFFIGAASLVAMAVLPLPSMVKLGIFLIFAVVLSMQLTLDYPYLSELFDDSIRGTGVGFCVTMSRVGAALGTFVLPIVIGFGGMNMTMLMCAIVLIVGGLVCLLWAPETTKE